MGRVVGWWVGSCTLQQHPVERMGHGPGPCARASVWPHVCMHAHADTRARPCDTPRTHMRRAHARHPTQDEDVQIEYVSAPLDLGTASEAEQQEEQQQAEEPADEEMGGLGLGMGGGLGFSKPKVRSLPACEPAQGGGALPLAPWPNGSKHAHTIGPIAQEDPYAEFKKIFERFATAEQVTGLVPWQDEDEEGAEGRGGEVRLQCKHTRALARPGCALACA